MQQMCTQHEQRRQRGKRRGRRAALVIALLLLFMWANNTNLFCRPQGSYCFLAHRGLAQTFDVSAVEWDTNTAQMIDPPEHPYLENTLASMQAAFACGAQCVELDVQLTRDGELAVFHDYDLGMRTDLQGSVGAYTMQTLKTADIGYGYTADGGRTYPFRGTGVGQMPALSEVLETFADKELLIHINQGGLQTAQVLWTYLCKMEPARRAQIRVYGDSSAMAYLRQMDETLCVMSAAQMKRGLLVYALIGWTGYVPRDLRNSQVRIPLRYARFLWGWPNRFVQRMQSAGTCVMLVEGDGRWSEGFDTAASLEAIPDGYTGYVWTNRIDRVGAYAAGMDTME